MSAAGVLGLHTPAQQAFCFCPVAGLVAKSAQKGVWGGISAVFLSCPRQPWPWLHLGNTPQPRWWGEQGISKMLCPGDRAALSVSLLSTHLPSHCLWADSSRCDSLQNKIQHQGSQRKPCCLNPPQSLHHHQLGSLPTSFTPSSSTSPQLSLPSASVCSLPRGKAR